MPLTDAQLIDFRVQQDRALVGAIFLAQGKQGTKGDYLYITADGKKCKVKWEIAENTQSGTPPTQTLGFKLWALNDSHAAVDSTKARVIRAAYGHILHALHTGLIGVQGGVQGLVFLDVDPYLDQVLRNVHTNDLSVDQWKQEYQRTKQLRSPLNPATYWGSDTTVVNTNHKTAPDTTLPDFDPARNGLSGGGGGGGSGGGRSKPSWWDDDVDGPWDPWFWHPYWGKSWSWRKWWGLPPFWKKSWTVTYGPGSKAHTAALTKADRSLRDKIGRAISSGKAPGRVVVLGKSGKSKTAQALKSSFPGVPVHVRQWGPSADQFLRDGLRKSNYVITQNPSRASDASRYRLGASRSRGTRVSSSRRGRRQYFTDVGDLDYPPLTSLDETFGDEYDDYVY